MAANDEESAPVVKASSIMDEAAAMISLRIGQDDTLPLTSPRAKAQAAAVVDAFLGGRCVS